MRRLTAAGEASGRAVAGLSAHNDGDILAVTSNGTCSVDIGGRDFCETFLKLSTNGGLNVADYFMPSKFAIFNQEDADLGSGGPLLLPNQTSPPVHLVTGAGKEATVYLVDRHNMGHFNAAGDSQIVQSLPHPLGYGLGSAGSVRSSPAYWQNNLYWLGVNDVLKVFRLSNGLLSARPISRSAAPFFYPEATPAISANGLNEWDCVGLGE